MNKQLLRGVVVPSLIALVFVVLDLLMDRTAGGPLTLNVPHVFFSILVVLTVFFSMRQVARERARSEQEAQLAREALENRVHQRTAELEEANARLHAEIAERQRVEAALRESRQIERALMDASPDSALLFDGRGMIWAANEPAAQRIGGTVENMIGADMFDLFRPEVISIRRAALKQVLQTGQPVHYTEEAGQSSMEISIHPVLDAEGKIALLAAYGRDITERKQAERALSESEERYRSLFDNFPEPMTVWSRDGVLLMQNLVSARNLGGQHLCFPP